MRRALALVACVFSGSCCSWHVELGTTPLAADGSGRVGTRHGIIVARTLPHWWNGDQGLSIRIGAEDWERSSDPARWDYLENVRRENTLWFAIAAKARHQVIFDPAQVRLVDGRGAVSRPECLIMGRLAKAERRCGDLSKRPVAIRGQTIFRLEFPVAVLDGHDLIVEGLSKRGATVALPRLELVREQQRVLQCPL